MWRTKYPSITLALVAGLLAGRPAPGAVIERSVAELTGRAGRIVVGDVVDVQGFWDAELGLIRSRVWVAVDTYLVGSGPGLEVLVLSGGTLGDRTLQVSVLPVFEPGDHVLLFLRAGESGLVESFQGAYLTDGQEVVRMAPACRRIIPETRRPLAELLAEVQAALPAGAVLPEVAEYAGGFQLPPGGERYAFCGYSWAYQPNPMGETYRINANCVDAAAGDAASQRTQIQNGAAAWNAAGADFAFVYGGESTLTAVTYDGVNLIYFDTTPPDGGGYVAATYIWASGGNITECDLVFNDAEYTWWNGSGTCSGRMDIWNISTHELGHFLCLADLYGGADADKTMYGYTGYCETKKRTLHTDDVNGIVALYGLPVPDTTPPTPDPMAFDVPPHATGPTSIAMTAALATDADSPPPWYEFDFVAGGTGGTDSGWLSTRSYSDTGLAPNTYYSYRVRARDSADPPNLTAFSATLGAYTLASVPGAPLVGNPTGTTLDLDVVPGDNPPATEFAVRCASSPDAAWSGKYLDASGQPAAAPVWRTDAEWGVLVVQGLAPETQYCFHVRARNADLLETFPSAQACATTLAAYAPGDMDCDGQVTFADIDPFVTALGGYEGYHALYPDCEWLNADCNGDGNVTFADIDAFVIILSG